MSYVPAIYDSFATLMVCVEAIIDEIPPEQIAPLYQKIDLTSENPNVMMQICKLAPAMILEIASDSEKCDELSLCHDVMYFFRVLAKDQHVSHLSDRDQARFKELEARFEKSPFVTTKLEYHVRYEYDKTKVPHFLVQQFQDTVGTKFIDALEHDPKADLNPIEKEFGVTLTEIESPGRKENRVSPPPPKPRTYIATRQLQDQPTNDAPLLSDIDRRINNRNSAFLIGKPLEQETPRLWTDNPPQSMVEQAHSQKIDSYFLAVFCFLAVFLTLVVGAINIYWTIVPLAGAVGLGILGCKLFLKSKESKKKWETSYHTVIYNPPLKSGKNAIVEIQLEIPVGWGTPETLSQLENCAKPSLYELFSGLDTVPLRSNVFDCIEHQLVLKQRELSLGICRMQLLRNFDPEMPPFGAEQVYRTADALITYEITDLWRVNAVNRKISEILLSHPADELIEYSKALNIHIIDVKKRPVTDSSEKYSDW